MSSIHLDKMELADLITDRSGDYKVIGGLQNIADAIKGLSHEVLNGGLQFIDAMIAKLEEMGDVGYMEIDNIPHLTRWYEILYDELQSRTALDTLMNNLTGKGATQ